MKAHEIWAIIRDGRFLAKTDDAQTLISGVHTHQLDQNSIPLTTDLLADVSSGNECTALKSTDIENEGSSPR